jgi:hypothetical protein
MQAEGYMEVSEIPPGGAYAAIVYPDGRVETR